jgi:hypothetical protein
MGDLSRTGGIIEQLFLSCLLDLAQQKREHGSYSDALPIGAPSETEALGSQVACPGGR